MDGRRVFADLLKTMSGSIIYNTRRGGNGNPGLFVILSLSTIILCLLVQVPPTCGEHEHDEPGFSRGKSEAPLETQPSTSTAAAESEPSYNISVGAATSNNNSSNNNHDNMTESGTDPGKQKKPPGGISTSTSTTGDDNNNKNSKSNGNLSIVSPAPASVPATKASTTAASNTTLQSSSPEPRPAAVAVAAAAAFTVAQAPSSPKQGNIGVVGKLEKRGRSLLLNRGSSGNTNKIQGESLEKETEKEGENSGPENGQIPEMEQNDETKPASIGYVAEWESAAEDIHDIHSRKKVPEKVQLSPLDLQGKTKSKSKSKTKASTGERGKTETGPEASSSSHHHDHDHDHPSHRIGPGTWQDSSISSGSPRPSTWWLFGGAHEIHNQNQVRENSSSSSTSSSSSSSISSTGSTTHRYLSDLWMYDDESAKWSLIFRPQQSFDDSDHDNDPDVDRDRDHPAPVIHSSYPENLAFPQVCGSTSEGHIAVFGGVTKNPETSRQSNPGSTSGESPLLTDSNIVWLFDIPKVNSKSNRTPKSGQWDASGGLWTSYICCDACLPDGEQNSTLDFCPQFYTPPILWCAQDSLMALQIVPPKTVGNTKTNSNLKAKSNLATWWKFDLKATEWEKMPEVKVEVKSTDEVDTANPLTILQKIDGADCRTVSDGTSVYIICPLTKGQLLERSVVILEPGHGQGQRGSLRLLSGKMELNNEFRDEKSWDLGRSSLHALRIEKQNMTIIFLAYHKLLDLWIHDHQSDRLIPVENVWKGSSLHFFQQTRSFYKISVSISLSGGMGVQSAPKNYSFFMENPRSRQFEFGLDNKTGSQTEADAGSGAHHRFHISIVTDQSVFLPARDASFLINPKTKESGQKQNRQLEEQKQKQQPQSDNHKESLENLEKRKRAKAIYYGDSSRGENPSGSFLEKSAVNAQRQDNVSSTNHNSRNTNASFAVLSPSNSPGVFSPVSPWRTKFESTIRADSQSKSGAKSNFSTSTTTISPPQILSSVKSSPGPIPVPVPNLNSSHSTRSKIMSKKYANVLKKTLTVQKNESKLASTVKSRVESSTVSPILVPVQVPVSIPAPVANATLSSISPANANVVTATQERKSLKLNTNSSSNSNSNSTRQPIKLQFTHPTAGKSGAKIINPKTFYAVKKSEAISIVNSRKSEETDIQRTKSPPPKFDPDFTPIVDEKESLRNNRMVYVTNAPKKGQLTTTTTVKKESPGENEQNTNEISNSNGAMEVTLSYTITEVKGQGQGEGELEEDEVDVLTSAQNQGQNPNLNPIEGGDENGALIPGQLKLRGQPGQGQEQADADASSDHASHLVSSVLGSSEIVFESRDSVASTGPRIQGQGQGHNPGHGRGYGRHDDEDHDHDLGDDPSSGGSTMTMTITSSSSMIPPPPLGSYSSMLFFGVSLSIFATFGMVLFVRRCVKCPPVHRREISGVAGDINGGVLIKEPPPIRYTVIPDELSYHTPIV